jgi:hypothetical protein
MIGGCMGGIIARGWSSTMATAVIVIGIGIGTSMVMGAIAITTTITADGISTPNPTAAGDS